MRMRLWKSTLLISQLPRLSFQILPRIVFVAEQI